MSNFSLKIPGIKYWLIAWISLYFLIILLGLIAPQLLLLTIIKISGIFLCTVYAIVTFPQDRLLIAAMFITSIADFLLAVNNISEVGLLTFVLAQALHFTRLSNPNFRPALIYLGLAMILLLVLDLVLHFTPPLYIICGFYTIIIILNILTCWHWYRAEPKNPYASCALLGFILFACCDLQTVISYFSLVAILPPFFYAPANFLAWFFYYPSQILVSNSTKCAIMAEKEGKCKMEVYGS